MPTTEDLYKWYEGRVDESFSNEAAPDGTKWKPLAAVTLMLGIASKKGFKKSGYRRTPGRVYGWSCFVTCVQSVADEQNEAMRRMATAVRVGRFADDGEWKKFIGSR